MIPLPPPPPASIPQVSLLKRICSGTKPQYKLKYMRCALNSPSNWASICAWRRRLYDALASAASNCHSNRPISERATCGAVSDAEGATYAMPQDRIRNTLAALAHDRAHSRKQPD